MTPIIYPIDLVPAKYEFIFDLNPNTLFVNAYRRVVLYGEDPEPGRVLIGLAVAVAAFVIGYFLFKKMEKGFADSI